MINDWIDAACGRPNTSVLSGQGRGAIPLARKSDFRDRIGDIQGMLSSMTMVSKSAMWYTRRA
jgi:hypothetical protein